VAVGASAEGPWTLATNLRGTENLIYDTVDDPDFVHELLRFTTQWVKVWLPVIGDTGVGVSLGEAAASCGVISPQIYRTFVKPYHQELVTYFGQRNLHLMLHMCGYIDPIMEDVVDTGVASLSIDSPSSLRKLVELSRRRVVIIGNVPTLLFAEGTKEQMEAAVKECIDIAAEGSGYILCSGCEIPLNSRKENIDYFMQAARNHGRYL
jgi:uroporphyrinogen decarboxylase